MGKIPETPDTDVSVSRFINERRIDIIEKCLYSGDEVSLDDIDFMVLRVRVLESILLFYRDVAPESKMTFELAVMALDENFNPFEDNENYAR